MRNHPQTWAITALDKLHNASTYIATQFRMDFARAEAKSNLEARSLIWNAQQGILRELGWPITADELNARLGEAKAPRVHPA